MGALANYFWRLLPGNPILLRVVAMGSKRVRDLLIRCVYLGAMVLIVLVALTGVSSNVGNDLAKLSDASTRIFQQLSSFQLILVALLAPIFTAGAITQEQDSQTYDVLLATPLSNAQIVVGSLFSRLFFVFALLLSGVPVFSITQIFGGVAFGDVVQSVLIAAVTALVTGALAIAIATFKIGTRRSIFSFYLLNVIYLVGLYLLAQLPQLRIPRIDADGAPMTPSGISYLAGFHPFLALQVVLDPLTYAPPTPSQLTGIARRWPLSWAASSPVEFFLTFSIGISLILILPSVLLLRRVAQSTTTFVKSLTRLLRLSKADQTRTPRVVWNNPIAWREGNTKVSAAQSVFIRFGLIIAGIVAAGILAVSHSTESSTPRRYVDAGSYNPVAKTVFIRGASNLAVDDNTRVRLNTGKRDRFGNEQWDAVSLDELNRRYAVERFAAQQRGTVQYLTAIDLRPIPRRIDTPTVRQFLLGLVLLEVVTIVLIITNAAASTVTREKEDGTLDLLLCTPITSRYYMWGKVRGLISYVLPLIVVPVASCALFVLIDFLRLIRSEIRLEDFVVRPEALLLVPPLLIVINAFAAMTGIYMSLALRTTVLAVMSSVGIVLGVFGGLGFCGYSLVASTNNIVAVAVSSFSPFTVLSLLISPETTGWGVRESSSNSVLAPTLIVFTLVAIAAYGGLLYSAYTSIVRNFDMTLRKQSR